MSGGVGTSEVDQTGPSASALKTYKLNIHTVQFCTEDLVIRSEDFPDVSPGDVLEFYHEEETFSRLLLQVSQESLYPENKLSKPVPKDTVYILKTIAESFHLSNFKSLVVNKVQKENVGLDSVELLFKEQYLGRSEMWRLKKSLIDSVVFLKKKIGFCKVAIWRNILWFTLKFRIPFDVTWARCGGGGTGWRVVWSHPTPRSCSGPPPPWSTSSYRWAVRCGTLTCTGTYTLRRLSMVSSTRCSASGRRTEPVMRSLLSSLAGSCMRLIASRSFLIIWENVFNKTTKENSMKISIELLFRMKSLMIGFLHWHYSDKLW